MKLFILIVFALTQINEGLAYSCPEQNYDFEGNDIGEVGKGIPGVNSWSDCGKNYVLEWTFDDGHQKQ